MESSTVVAFRALVLVACLIVVPLAAIFGSQFPDVVKSVLVDRIFPNGVPGMAKADPDRDTAPEFKVATTEPTAWQASQPSGAPPAAAGAGQQGSSGAPAWNGSGVEPAVAWNQQPGQVRPAALEGPPGGQPAGAERLGVAVPNDPRAGYPGNPNSQAARPAAAAGGMAPPSAHLLNQPDRFTVMERRLRELGATYYLLERWNESEYYRFHCKMAIANDAAHTRQFEATDTDPMRAMGRVVEQIEAWRAGRLQ